MKNIKKKWEQQLDAVMPPLREDVRQAPISDIQKKEKRSILSLFGSPSGRRSALAGALALVLVVCLAVPVLRPEPVPVVTAQPGAVLVEINPSVVFSVDEQGSVVTVVAANADADVVLADEERQASYIGIPIASAVERFVEDAAYLGYLDLDEPSAIRISSCLEGNETFDDDLQQQLQSYFRHTGAYVAVASERLDPEGFCRRAGLSLTQTPQELLAMVAETSAFFFERHEDVWEETYAQAMDLQARLEQIFQRLFDLPLLSQERKQELVDNAMENLQLIFSLLGIDEEKIAEFQTPASCEEYLQRIRTYCQEKAEAYQQKPDGSRKEISQEDYDAYLKQIMDQFGSLEKYWEEKK